MRISEYPAYKPSGSKWLGDIPAHWKVSRLKYVAASNFSGVNKHTVDDETPVRLCNYVDVYYNDYITPDIAFMEATATQTEIARFTLKKGDVLVTKDSEAWDDIAIPAYVVSDLQGILCGYHLAHIRAAIGVFHGEYLFRAFSASGINDQFMVEATGITRYGLGKYGLDNSLFPLPPIEEQHAIAAFLNYETKLIDQLIARKERQIELLQEKRSALISHVVTKGLNPKAKMKDSGIEWLGEIPEHWRVCLFKRVVKVSYGVGGELDRTLMEGTRILSLPNVSKNGCFVLDDIPYTELPISQADSLLLQKGDLLFNWRNGSSEHLGKTAYFDLEGDYTHVSFLIRLRFNPEQYESKYYQLLLNGFQITGFFASSKAGVNNTFNQSELENLWVMVPTLQEQREIADYLNRELKQIDKMISKIEHSIATLREYRITLISAAVTGKIDVRGVTV